MCVSDPRSTCCAGRSDSDSGAKLASDCRLNFLIGMVSPLVAMLIAIGIMECLNR